MLKVLLSFLFIFSFSTTQIIAQPEPIRIIMIGAHPDDCDQGAGGLAILMSQLGHQVKFVSVTNGDAGHQTMGGGALANRRYQEAQEAGKRFGVTYDVLSNHDGELVPSLEIRMQIIRKIREWNADVVIAPRPNDYHPDHRYTGVLVQDAAYMVAVPNIAPETKPLKKNPVFLYYQDRFQKPNVFRPDIAVDISPVFEKKIYAMAAHESQFFEWLPWIGGYAAEVPKGEKERLTWLGNQRKKAINPEIQKSLEKWYGPNKATNIKYFEAFELCEYGNQPNADEIKRLLPILK
jgi:LmbE family N-acetylglucosaminyl deacetylase